MIVPGDTTSEAALRQFQILSRLSLEDRARMRFELSENVRQVLIDGIRSREPDLSKKEIIQRVLAMTLPTNVYEAMVKDRGL